MENILNNYKLYTKIEKYNKYRYINIYENWNNYKPENDALYIESIDELLTTANSHNIFLCFLHDLLIKLKLNAEITITNNIDDVDSSSDDDDNDDDQYDSNFITKQIKIGYVKDESKTFNEDFGVYQTNGAILLSYINEFIEFRSLTTREERLNKLFNIFMYS